MPEPITDDAQKWVDGLRAIADFAESHPDLINDWGWYGQTFNIFATNAEDMVKKTRILGTAEKTVSAGFYTMRRKFGPHSLELNISRETFCEKKKVGTKIVRVVDPEYKRPDDIPMVEIEEDVYEWVCPESVLNHTPDQEAEEAAESGDVELTPFHNSALAEDE